MQCLLCGAPEGKPHATRCPQKQNGTPVGAITSVLYPDSKNKRAFEDGIEFQDWVVEQFNTLGFYIQLHSSKRFQLDKGESVQRVEIKLDKRCTDTGRLSIEVGERGAEDRQWVESGIYAREDTIFYVQGTRDRLYLFDRRVLVRYHMAELGGAYEEGPPTIRKFYLSFEKADDLCILRIPMLEQPLFLPSNLQKNY